jgi:hypothetical protein
VENELVEPSESGRILVLLADRLLENIDFDVAGLFREAAGRKKSLKARIQVLNEADRESGRRTKARAAGNIRD